MQTCSILVLYVVFLRRYERVYASLQTERSMTVVNTTGDSTLFVLLAALTITVTYAGLAYLLQRHRWHPHTNAHTQMPTHKCPHTNDHTQMPTQIPTHKCPHKCPHTNAHTHAHTQMIDSREKNETAWHVKRKSDLKCPHPEGVFFPVFLKKLSTNHVCSGK